MKFYTYAKCSTCQKAKKWLLNHQYKFEEICLMTNTPNEETLKKIIQQSGQPVRKFFNAQGLVYREMGLASKIDGMSFDEQIALLASNGKLIKRPLIVTDQTILIGFSEKNYINQLESSKAPK